MLGDIKRMVIFTHVVEAGSFSGAAKKLGIVKSAISKHVSLLEKHIGARLLNRSTRGMRLTEIGETYYEICTRIVEATEEAKRCTNRLNDEPYGTLRIASPLSMGADVIAPLLKQFLQNHQNLKAELLLDDHIVDMVAENIDVSIRVGWLPDSSLRARKLRTAQRILCASPDYIEQYGMPTTLEQLSQHQWIIFTLLPTPYHCIMSDKQGKEKTVQVKGRIKTNNSHAVLSLLREGEGMAGLSDMMIAEDLKSGRLIHVLPEYSLAEVGVYAVYQDQQLIQSKTRRFIDFLVEKMEAN